MGWEVSMVVGLLLVERCSLLCFLPNSLRLPSLAPPFLSSIITSCIHEDSCQMSSTIVKKQDYKTSR